MIDVAVLGANGHTGRFVVQELLRRGVGVIPAVRPGAASPATGEAIEARPIIFEQPGSLDAAIHGAAAVINCAGPFLDTAELAAEAAIRAGIPYLDCTAEQMAALNLFEKLDFSARTAGVTIVPAMAFYGSLADLLATALMGEGDVADSIEVAVALDQWQPTTGTRTTGARNHYPRLTIQDGQLAPLDVTAPSRSWNFPEPFGTQQVSPMAFSEVILIQRHLKTNEQISLINAKALADVRDPSTPTPVATDDRGRSAQRFCIDVKVRRGNRTSQASASGQDIYAITAPLIVSACLELIHSDTPSGVRAPGEIFDPVPFLAGLAPDLSTTFDRAD